MKSANLRKLALNDPKAQEAANVILTKALLGLATVSAGVGAGLGALETARRRSVRATQTPPVFLGAQDPVRVPVLPRNAIPPEAPSDPNTSPGVLRRFGQKMTNFLRHKNFLRRKEDEEEEEKQADLATTLTRMFGGGADAGSLGRLLWNHKTRQLIGKPIGFISAPFIATIPAAAAYALVRGIDNKILDWDRKRKLNKARKRYQEALALSEQYLNKEGAKSLNSVAVDCLANEEFQKQAFIPSTLAGVVGFGSGILGLIATYNLLLAAQDEYQKRKKELEESSTEYALRKARQKALGRQGAPHYRVLPVPVDNIVSPTSYKMD